MTLDFKEAGDEIYLLGSLQNDLGCSVYLHELLGETYSPAPHFDLDEELALHQLVRSLIKSKLIGSAHDCSEGGLFVTLMEKAFPREIGFEVSSPERAFDGKPLRLDACWFGESQGRVVVTVSPPQRAAFLQHTASGSTPVILLGTVGGTIAKIDGQSWGEIKSWKSKYDSAIESTMLMGNS